MQVCNAHGGINYCFGNTVAHTRLGGRKLHWWLSWTRIRLCY